MAAARLLLRALLVLASAAAFPAAAVPIFGQFTDDCLNALDAPAAGGELYAVKYPRTDDTPDILFNATATGGGSAVVVLAPDNWSVDERWNMSVQPTSSFGIALTLPGRVAIDAGNSAFFGFEACKPQVVGAMDGVRPEVVATSWGYELRFRPLRQLTPPEAPSCAVAGPPDVGLRHVIGYNVYRLAGTGNPSLTTFRTAGFLGFIDARTLDVDLADPTGFGCSDMAPADDARMLNPNGVMDDGDEVVVFRDLVRNATGRRRADAPDPRASYVYRVQPVLRGDMAHYEFGGRISSGNLPASTADRDGDGVKESVDLLSDGTYEFVDPERHGLGLTWDGEILSSPSPGQATPLAAPADPDADGIPTTDEAALGLNPNASNATLDSDADGPLDPLEAAVGSSPRVADHDGGGERDGREMFYGRSALNPCDDLTPTNPLGDVYPAGGGDGAITISDAVRTLRFAVRLETPTAAELVVGDIGPADEADAGASPPRWKRHGTADGMGQHPFGYREHGDGVIDIVDAVLNLRQVVGSIRVID